MTAWPTSLTVGPLREWPGDLTPGPSRRAAPFSAPMTATLDLLHREIRALADTIAQERTAELLVAIPAGAFRRDGYPYANAKAEHPGIVFSMDSRHGRISYAADSFLMWEDNLRGVALGLEALRKVERYGIAKHGEQYRGYLALEAGTLGGDAAVQAALDVVARFSDATLHVGDSDDYIRARLRVAQRAAHPDTNGTAEGWLELSAAVDVLKRAGRL